jgi:SAM-dependent methyltransferase
MPETHEALLRAAILDSGQLIEAVFQDARRGESVTWSRVAVRPVVIKNERRLQFVYSDGVQAITKNADDQQAAERLEELLALPFKSIRAVTSEGTIRVQFSKKGKPIVHHERRDSQAAAPALAHDRAKPGILAVDEPPPFLRALGLTTADGRPKADHQRKLRQINEFLRLIEETGEIERLDADPVRVVDLGCGSAALTFATYHYLNAVKGIPARLVGVDTKAPLLERHRVTAAGLGWDGMTFESGRIEAYEPTDAPQVVLALHACDTATDEALARAVGWRSHLIFSAPCCHHHLQAQLAAGQTPEPFRPVLRHGILRERLGDVLTDALRAHILRLLGYRAEVLEFVAVEHTPKNLMIRAVRTGAPTPAALVAEYKALKEYWGVTPYLETLLSEELQPILAMS